MHKEPLLPFWLYPFSWGLKGKARDIAEANYRLSGYDLERKLLEIESGSINSDEAMIQFRKLQLKYKHITQSQYDHYLVATIKDPKEQAIALAKLDLSGHELESKILELTADEYTPEQFQEAVLKLDYKYGKVHEDVYHRALVNLIQDPIKKAMGLLELDYKEGKIDFFKYDKEMHTLQGKPWVNVLKMDFAPGKPEEGAFELDWNELFIKDLENAGYTGASPDQLINIWFMEVCRNVALETFDGTGDFTENSQETLNRQDGNLPGGRRAHQ